METLGGLQVGLSSRDVEIMQKKAHTYADYCLLPEGTPCQLIGGKLIMTPAPDTYHQAISMRLGVEMANFTAGKKSGMVFFAPVDVFLEDTEIYQPDIIFIAADRLHIIEPAGVRGAPDLVVEILYPSTAYYDLRKKFKVYARSGVREYWIADPHDRSIEVYKGKEGKFAQTLRVEGEGKAGSSVLEGFAVEVKVIFADIASYSRLLGQ